MVHTSLVPALGRQISVAWYRSSSRMAKAGYTDKSCLGKPKKPTNKQIKKNLKFPPPFQKQAGNVQSSPEILLLPTLGLKPKSHLVLGNSQEEKEKRKEEERKEGK